MRKEKDVTISDEGRDKGKTYSITEMPASQAERWAHRLFLVLAKSGVEFPEFDQPGTSMAHVAAIGLVRSLGGMAWHDAEPLLDEMMHCVKIRPDPNHPMVARDLIETDIEEVRTRLHLRMEVFELHTGFSFAGFLSTSEAPAQTQPETAKTTSQSTATSPAQ